MKVKRLTGIGIQAAYLLPESTVITGTPDDSAEIILLGGASE
jgi:hypothetical protein